MSVRCFILGIVNSYTFSNICIVKFIASPKRQQGLPKEKYEASIIEKQFNFKQARSDGLLAQYYLTKTWELLKTNLYVRNEYNVCEPVRGYKVSENYKQANEIIILFLLNNVLILELQQQHFELY